MSCPGRAVKGSGPTSSLHFGAHPQRPLRCLDRVFWGDVVLQCAPVDFHAGKWASAARIISDLLISFLAAASSRASSSSAVSRTATTCIGSAPRPWRPRTPTLEVVDVVSRFGLVRTISESALRSRTYRMTRIAGVPEPIHVVQWLVTLFTAITQTFAVGRSLKAAVSAAYGRDRVHQSRPRLR